MNLPDGWVAEYPEHMPSCMVLCSPEGGFATIDFSRRIYSYGYGFPRREWKGPHYSGRGWKDRIVVDAVRGLSAIMGEPPVK